MEVDREDYISESLFELDALKRPRPIAEYHEDMGPVLWWKFPIEEPPYCGGPNDLGFTVEAHTRTRVLTAVNQTHSPSTHIESILVGGWPGYHTHWTPLPKVSTP